MQAEGDRDPQEDAVHPPLYARHQHPTRHERQVTVSAAAAASPATPSPLSPSPTSPRPPSLSSSLSSSSGLLLADSSGGGRTPSSTSAAAAAARDDHHRSLSDTDQPHQQQQRHTSVVAPTPPHFIHLPSSPPSAVSPPHAFLPQHQHSASVPSPAAHPPTTLHIRPVSISGTPAAALPPPPPPSFHAALQHVVGGGRTHNATRPTLTLLPLDTRPRLSHTRSCPNNPHPPSSFVNGVHRQVSVPVAPREVQATMAERQLDRPNVLRSISRTQTIKNYIRKSTATFFGVDGENEEDHRRRWAERRKRMATKRYGKLKEAYQAQSSRDAVDGSSSAGVAPPSLVTPDSFSSRSWPRQVSRMSDVDSTATTSPGVHLRSHPSWAQKDSVVRLTWDGLTYIASTVARRRRRTAVSQPTSRVQLPNRNFFFSTDDSVFEDSAGAQSPQPELSVPSTGVDSVMEDVFYDRITPSSPSSTFYLPPEYLSPPPPPPPLVVQPQPTSLSSVPLSAEERVPTGWRRSVPVPEVPEQDELSVGMRRMWKRITDQLFDNSDRRQYGIGVVGRYLKRSFRKDRITTEVKEQLEDMDDHRPFFTYWVTTVQILITIISLAVYGFGPVGFEQTRRSGLVLVTSLSLQQVDYFEPDNFWIGPRAADLVHLGAKFAPCMRHDQNVFEAIATDRSQERNTACCIRNDNSGCVQTSRDECSTTISTWKKWHSKDTGPGGRISGSVCGQDPSYCSDPPSAPPYNWPDDITKWPICKRKVRSDLSRAAHEHMACEVIGHPCCIGILGECQITTREYCDFVKGFFHEEAALCSQVSCLDDICGMIPFYSPNVPDQFYRLWTSLFLHAGLVHLSVTVLVQYFLMCDLEKLTGALRICLIYMVSGMAGNLASAIFVPYRAEVGPAGSQFGLIACLIVEVIHSWRMLKKPGVALSKLVAILVALFFLGLLPWVDNYAHLFGFLFGFLLSYALLPFVSFGVYDRRKKITLIWICLLSVTVLFFALLLLFYIYPIYECEYCKYLTCLPLAQHFCTTQDINITTQRQL